MDSDDSSTEWRAPFQRLSAEVAELRMRLEAASTRADAADDRARQGEDLAVVQRGRTERLEVRADASDSRMDHMQAEIDVDHEVILELQSEGLLGKERVEHLERALRSSRLIGAALGIVMANHKVDETRAFAILSRASQDSNRKLALLAEDVVRTGTLDPLPSM